MCEVQFNFRYTCEDILKTFEALKMKNTCDLWDISIEIIIHIIDYISPVLVDIFNSCIDKGIFPVLRYIAKFCRYLNEVVIK